MEPDEEDEWATKRRRSRIRSINVNVNDVLAMSIASIDVTEKGPSCLDNG